MDESKVSLAGYVDPAPENGQAARMPARTGVNELRNLQRLIVATLVLLALYFAQDVLIPITLAIILSFVLSPVVDTLQRMGLWRAPSVIVAILLALGAIGLVGTMIGSEVASLATDAPRYARTIERKVEGFQAFANKRLGELTRQFEQMRPSGVGAAPATAVPHATLPNGPANAQAPEAVREPMQVELASPATSPFQVARTILEPILGPIETTFIVLVVAIFILLQKEDLRDRFIRLFGSNDLHRTTIAMDDAGRRLSRYFLSQLTVNTSFGVIISLGLWLIGVPSPALWGALAGMLRFVPYVGILLAALAPIALSAAVAPGWTMSIQVAILFLAVDLLTGNIIEPLVYGRSTGLSPVSVIIAAVFWAWMWGPIGLILSTPLTLCLVVLGRHVKSLDFFDVLLGDRPALSPIESFYQRVLANNPDEALAQAESLLADRPLADYFTEVVLPATKLAAEDVARGTLGEERGKLALRTMQAVIEDLRDHGPARNAATPDANGAQAMQPDSPSIGRILCVAGPGPFDEAVATMACLLFEQRGLAAAYLSNADVARQAIRRLEFDDPRVILLCGLELPAIPASLRYLIRRLRQRLPDASIVLGLFAESDLARSLAGGSEAIGADAIASTLDEAVDFTLRLGAAAAPGRMEHEAAQPV